MLIGTMDSFKNKKINVDNNITLRIKFQRRRLFTFSFMLFFFITYSYRASFYQNVIKAQFLTLTYLITQKPFKKYIKSFSKIKCFNMYMIYCVKCNKWYQKIS